jgi:hypothetical protein
MTRNDPTRSTMLQVHHTDAIHLEQLCRISGIIGLLFPEESAYTQT